MNRLTVPLLLSISVTLWPAGCQAPAVNRPSQALEETIVDTTELPVVETTTFTLKLPTPTPDPQAAERARLQEVAAGLGNWGPAPDILSETWLNSAPVRLADLRGKVVLVEFWTFGCINCIHVTPYLRAWHDEYHAAGLEIIGVHTPEFTWEHDPAGVQAAATDLGVTWPIAIDNNKATWHAYSNRFWPAVYFIDRQGDLRHLAIGEGNYERSAEIIRALLAEEAG
jgi:thiol-disulfide isomerase/thioredoxin